MIKRLFALLFVFLFVIGCTNSQETPEQKPVGFITFTMDDNWQIINETETEIEIEKTDSKDLSKLFFGLVKDVSPKEQVEKWLETYPDSKQLDNITINNIEYLVVEKTTDEGKYMYLSTSYGDFNEEAKGTIIIEISIAIVDDVKAMLETLVINKEQ